MGTDRRRRLVNFVSRFRIALFSAGLKSVFFSRFLRTARCTDYNIYARTYSCTARAQ